MLVALNVYQNLLIQPGEVKVRSLINQATSNPIGAVPISYNFHIRLGEGIELVRTSIQKSSTPLNIVFDTSMDSIQSYDVLTKDMAFVSSRLLGNILIISDKVIGFRYNPKIWHDRQYRNIYTLPAMQQLRVRYSVDSLKIIHNIMCIILNMINNRQRLEGRFMGKDIAIEYSNDVALNNRTMQYYFELHGDNYYYLSYIGYVP